MTNVLEGARAVHDAVQGVVGDTRDILDTTNEDEGTHVSSRS